LGAYALEGHQRVEIRIDAAKLTRGQGAMLEEINTGVEGLGNK
jgi:hypothetical protein